jgi:hypothetical protein
MRRPAPGASDRSGRGGAAGARNGSVVHRADGHSTRQHEAGCSASLPPDISPSRILKAAFQQRARCLKPPISPPPQPSSPAEAQEDLSDDFSRLLDEMDETLGEPTIPLLIRLGWLAGDRRKDHAAVVHGLCRFVGHLLDMTRNGRP